MSPMGNQKVKCSELIDLEMVWGLPADQLPAIENKDDFDLPYQEASGCNGSSPQSR
jgi:hypothetical protein